MVAYERVSELVDSGKVTPQSLAETERAIEEDIRAFESLLDGHNLEKEGGVAA